MSKSKIMKLIDPKTGLMKCTVCHETHYSELTSTGHFKRGSWQCVNGCQPDEKEVVIEKLLRTLKRIENIQKKEDHIKLQYKKIEIREQKLKESLEQKRKNNTNT